MGGLKQLIKTVLIKLRIIQPQKFFYTKDIFRHYENFEIGDFTYGEPTILFPNEAKLLIGKYCSIAQDVSIFLGGNHRYDWISTYPFSAIQDFKPQGALINGHPASKGDVVIGNDVWIGRNATLLSGVRVGNGAVIGAGSVVTKDIGAYEIWAGNPASFIKKRFTDDDIKRLEFIRWWDMSQNKICELIPYLCSDDINKIYEICSKE